MGARNFLAAEINRSRGFRSEWRLSVRHSTPKGVRGPNRVSPLGQNGPAERKAEAKGERRQKRYRDVRTKLTLML